jgi:opacity protein-like surface antigen
MQIKRILILLMIFCVMMTGGVAASTLESYTSPVPYRIVSILSSDTPERGEVAVGFSIEQSGSPDFYRYEVRVATGIWDNLELGINIPYLEDDHSSVEEIMFGAKHRLFNESEHSFSGAYILSLSIPAKDDVHSNQTSAGGGLILSKKVGPLVGHFNLLYTEQFDVEYKDELRSGLGVEFSAARGLKILGEIYAMKYTGSNNDFYLSEARFAYRFEGSNSIYSMVGVGVGLNDDSSSYRIFASVSMLFNDIGGSN